MSMKRKFLCLTCVGLMTLLVGCGKNDSSDFQDYQPIEMTESEAKQSELQDSETTQSETEQSQLQESDQKEPSDSDESVSKPGQDVQSEQSMDEPSDSTVPATEESEEGVVTVDYASALMYYNPDSYHMFTLDQSAYATQIGFEAKETVSDVSVLSLLVTDVPESGDPIFEAQVEYTLPELTPDMPLVVSAGLDGIFPTLGISFTDPDGDKKVYGVTMSGEDQSILLQEIQLAE